MNILHMQYAVEVARVGSLSQAARNLILAQPNLSRSIKELEGEIGIQIFERSTKGMLLTPEGEEFIGYAKEILNHIASIDKIYKTGAAKKQKFSISVPRACYISEALANFSKSIPDMHAEVFYMETNSERTISNILNSDYKLGIIRYAENYDKYFKAMLEEKGLTYEMIAEFTYKLIMSAEHPLAQKEKITFDDLEDYIRIAHADPYVPTLSMAKVVREELPDNAKSCIYIFERASQFDLLSKNHRTFMWVSPAPDDVLQKYNLVQKNCESNTRIYKDILVYKTGYKLTRLDQMFITELCLSRRRNLK
ncbi:MAG: LysR family transcriptional regulator [Oscillospiraceae bacterium]|nr:LysR family transcriptional regulator [Oscillospiraceae bacterium]